MIKLLIRKPDEQTKFISEIDNKLVMFPLFSELFNVAPVEKEGPMLVCGIWQKQLKSTQTKGVDYLVMK